MQASDLLYDARHDLHGITLPAYRSPITDHTSVIGGRGRWRIGDCEKGPNHTERRRRLRQAVVRNNHPLFPCSPQVVEVHATHNTHMQVITCLSYDMPTVSVDRLIG
jgi:hypothetical protein